MEKGKKEGVKKQETKLIEKGESENKVVFTPSVKKGAQIIAILLAFFASAASIFMFVFGIIVSLKIIDLTKLELLTDNFSVTFLANLHGGSISQVKELIGSYTSKELFIIFKVAVPVIAFVIAMILAIILAKSVMDFVTEITTEKELYVKKNVYALEKMACYLMTILTILLLIFESPSLIIFALISLLVFIALQLFKKVVYSKK